MLEPLILVDWDDPGEMMRDAGIYEKIMAFCMGIYGFVISFPRRGHTQVYELIRAPECANDGLKVPYLLGRYSVIAMFAVLNKLDYHTIMIECDIEYKFIAVTFMLGTGCASLNLAIRTAVIWMHAWYAIVVLTALAIVHWGFAAAVKFIRTDYDSFYGACLIVQTHADALTGLYIATLIFDMLILIASIAGLLRGGTSFRTWGMHDIRRVLFKQGIGYFILTCIILARLNFNTIMDIILSVPALVISMMASCHCVTSLILTCQEYQKRAQDPEIVVLEGTEEAQFTSRIDIPPPSSAGASVQGVPQTHLQVPQRNCSPGTPFLQVPTTGPGLRVPPVLYPNR
ncbi:hypothetical protein OE88DRAFT_1738696 [Heliocybe sulcata]|uniref:Uncharacterized protein n=1 Tax=Heliocybe sulcata TaxID=5364 RepID=A0A5C3MPT7_9AGAM|nr:hypothetical protein OE88DRAFT_1738696 [Heliocybe sulcata]